MSRHDNDLIAAARIDRPAVGPDPLAMIARLACALLVVATLASCDTIELGRVNEHRIAALHTDPVLQAVPSRSKATDEYETPYSADMARATLQFNQLLTTRLTAADFIASYLTYLHLHGWAWIRVTCNLTVMQLHGFRKVGSLYRTVDVLADRDSTASLELETPRKGGYLAPFGPRSRQIDAKCPAVLRGL
jgi:hypothetical protein